MDADGQHKSSDVALVIEKLRAGSNLVIGNRQNFQRFGEKLFGALCGWRYGISDPFCGLKGYRNLGFYDSKSLASQKFDGVGTHAMFSYLMLGVRPDQVDIFSPPRVGDSRFGRGLRTELLLMKTIWCSLATYFFRFKGNNHNSKL